MPTAARNETQPQIPFYRSVRGKLATLLVCVIGLTTVSLTAIDYAYVRHTVRADIRNELLLHTQGISEFVRVYAKEQEEKISLIVGHTRIRQLLKDVYSQSLSIDAVQEDLNAIFGEIKQSSGSIGRIRIVDLAGTVIASDDPGAIGDDLNAMPFFHSARVESVFDLISSEADVVNAHLGAPVLSENDKALAVTIVDFDAAILQNLFYTYGSGHKHKTNRSRLGTRTHDNSIRYLFVHDPEHQAVEVVPERDHPMALALSGAIGFSDGMLDYRGVEVLAAYAPVGYRDWALVIQVDAHDAYQPIRDALGIIVFVGVVYLILALFVAVYSARVFLRPIMRLAKVTREVSNGNLDAKVKIETRDEIGALGYAFNDMTARLLKLRDSLEVRVHERTEQLEQTSQQLDLLVRTLESQADLMERDLRRAEVIQRSLMPRDPPKLNGYCINGLYIPGRNVGGDLYDAISIDEDHTTILVADAAGHGVSAAMLSVLFKHRLKAINDPRELLAPKSVFARVNDALFEDVSAPGVFVTALLCVLDVGKKEITVASAGHPPLLVVRAGGDVEQIKSTGPALGLYIGTSYEERKLKLGEGDRIMLYTDGLFDISGGKSIDIHDIAESLCSDLKGNLVLDEILRSAIGDREYEDRDDVTMMLLDVVDGESHFERRDTLAEDSMLQAAHTNGRVSPISYEESETRTFLCLDDRVTWIHSQSLFDAATSVIDEGRLLVIDFSMCEHVDSAILGSLHEIVKRANAKKTNLLLQGVATTLKQAFEELGMEDVIRHITDVPEGIPGNLIRMQYETPDARCQQLRLLKAHEVLATLNEQNRSQFESVISRLREDYVDKREAPLD